MMSKASKLLVLRRLSGTAKPSSLLHRSCSRVLLQERSSSRLIHSSRNLLTASRNFCSSSSNPEESDFRAPTAIDYRSLLQEDEFHKLANSTIHVLQEKFEKRPKKLQDQWVDEKQLY